MSTFHYKKPHRVAIWFYFIILKVIKFTFLLLLANILAICRRVNGFKLYNIVRMRRHEINISFAVNKFLNRFYSILMDKHKILEIFVKTTQFICACTLH